MFNSIQKFIFTIISYTTVAYEQASAMFPKALKTLQILSASDSPGPTLLPNIRVGSPLPVHTNILRLDVAGEVCVISHDSYIMLKNGI